MTEQNKKSTSGIFAGILFTAFSPVWAMLMGVLMLCSYITEAARGIRTDKNGGYPLKEDWKMPV